MRHFYVKLIVFPSLFVALVYVMVLFNFRQAPMPPEIAALFNDTERQLSKAHALAQSSQFKEAIDLLQHLHPSDPHEAATVETLRVVLAKQMFERAQNEFKRGNVDRAINIGSAIPSDTPAGKQFKTVARDWNRNQSVLELAKKFQEQGKDSVAIALLQQLAPEIRSGDIAKKIQSQVIAQQPSSASSEQSTSNLASSNSPTSSQIATATSPSQGEPQSYSEPEYQHSHATEYTEPEYRRDAKDYAVAAPSYKTAYRGGDIAPPERTADAGIESYRAKASAKRPLYSESGDGPTHDFSGFSN